MLFPKDKGFPYGLLNDSDLKEPFSTPVLIADSKLRFIVYYNCYFIFLLEETAEMCQERSKIRSLKTQNWIVKMSVKSTLSKTLTIVGIVDRAFLAEKYLFST